MSIPENSWRDAYAPLLGKALSEVVLMPVACDTPGVVDALDRPIIGYSGAAMLAFECDEDVYLTWKQVGSEFRLVTVDDLSAEWKRLSLDAVKVGSNSDWNRVRGATLQRVELFGFEGEPEAAVICATHIFTSDAGEAVLRVCTACRDEVDAGDDLLVSLNAEAPSSANLVARGVIR